MGILGSEEILARVHKFKLFRSEGNLYIDLYESLAGSLGNRFVAVPNLLLREADENFPKTVEGLAAPPVFRADGLNTACLPRSRL
jgi:hypothetical protein